MPICLITIYFLVEGYIVGEYCNNGSIIIIISNSHRHMMGLEVFGIFLFILKIKKKTIINFRFSFSLCFVCFTLQLLSQY